jgi:hypothetical protein
MFMVDIRRSAGIPVGTCSFSIFSLGAIGFPFWAGVIRARTLIAVVFLIPKFRVVPFRISFRFSHSSLSSSLERDAYWPVRELTKPPTRQLAKPSLRLPSRQREELSHCSRCGKAITSFSSSFCQTHLLTHALH